MIDFGTGDGVGVCFVIETKTEQDYERVKDALQLSQLDVFKNLKMYSKTYRWYETGFIIYNDHVALHVDIEEFRSSSTPIMSADTFMRFKITKRDNEYPTTITLEER